MFGLRLVNNSRDWYEYPSKCLRVAFLRELLLLLRRFTRRVTRTSSAQAGTDGGGG